eukprot:TRINITY_DN13025_c0_g1_i1.p1 TRINITY_DN13025_c0_g1~~TRINITY_DN13025_c0_g1_i1.p1  ORF type:complete len:240 (-),score=52.02 TRINITY_DN13025_c0_g1_i1:77-796(-)
MIQNPQVVADKSVLELGSGTGVCGIVAAQLGAQQVYLTDCVEKVLQILLESVELNVKFEGTQDLDEQGDFEDAESVDELDFQPSWDEGNMHVRYYDWEQSLNFLDNKSYHLQQQIQTFVPGLNQDDKFDVVIGAEVMYEQEHADFVAAAIKHKLEQNGICIICCAVRDLGVFTHFEKQCQKREIMFKKCQISESEIGDDGLIKKSKDYEGGFVIYYLQHLNSGVDWEAFGMQMQQMQLE